MLGHMSGAYAARVSRDLSLCSRYDFNVYSFESEWTMGAEWWIRSSLSKLDVPHPAKEVKQTLLPLASDAMDEVHGVVKVRASTSHVSFVTRYDQIHLGAH
jgi:distribution and morphology protein 10